jgi:hypothetical protein
MSSKRTSKRQRVASNPRVASVNIGQQLQFPRNEFRIQSPFLYLQSVGSTGADGSTYGAHLRWLLLGNLGDTHLPKGDDAGTRINFNRPDDYVTLSRSRYLRRFPTIVDFSMAPDVVIDSLAFWIYTATNTKTTVYIHFRDTAKYATLRTTIDPSVRPLEFVEKYCPGLIEAEVKDKLFFAAEFDVKRDTGTVMRAEALSVETNVPLALALVSCRKVFTDRNWCPPSDRSAESKEREMSSGREPASLSAEVPVCCDGPNLLSNGSFETPLGPDSIFTENFDAVTAPALPKGWNASNALGGGTLWATSTTSPDTAPNGAFVTGSPVTSDKLLDTPGIAIASTRAQLRFQNNFSLDFNRGLILGGGVLEVSSPNIDGGAFVDVTAPAVGGSFVTGGYTGIIDPKARNPLAGRMAWTGITRGYIDSVVNLGPNVAGTTIKLRFRLATDEAPGVRIWGIDSIVIAESGSSSAGFGFETDYVLQGGAKPGAINVTQDASRINSQWTGLPHKGKQFLTVDGSERKEAAVLRFKREVDRETDYCLTGWLSTLWARDVAIPIQCRFTTADGTVQTFSHNTPATVNAWEQFTFTWNSRGSRVVTVEIISMSVKSIGNDFGLDDLWFCKGKQKECRARILSENIRSVRFDVKEGYPRRLEFETYQDYLAGAAWETLDRLALTTKDNTAFSRLEPAANSVNGHWQKFNDNARLNVSNYKDRWTRSGGLRHGVQRYIALSDTDPMAVDTLPGDTQPQDGSIQVSLLDALRMVSLDFHAARMLGLGYLDRDIQIDADEFIYLGAYDTEGVLDGTNTARPVRHYYMGIPTKPLDYRLPDAPGLNPVTYGLTIDNGEPQPALLTDPQGYTPDGISRYINLFLTHEIDVNPSGPFFVPPLEFCSTDKTSSVFYGIEYRKQGETLWRKPEIASDASYQDLDTPPQFETSPVPNNADATKPILRHEEQENGIHEYGGYGINWFSRVSPLGNVVATDATLIKKAQRLLPPANFAVQLIQPESPLMLTTQDEQDMLAALSGSDKTLVRVTFDYFHVHDINYDFADTIQLFFRAEMPRNVVGGIKSVTDDPSDNHKAVIRTTDYTMNSQGTTLSPVLDPTLFANFIGGVLTCQQDNYIITDIAASTQLGEGPIFTVQKNVRSNASDPGAAGAYVTVQEYIAPNPGLSNSPLMFMAVENLADADSWGTANPLSKTITIGDSSWTTHTESYVQDGDTTTVKLRGVLSLATVTHAPTTAAQGVYQISFDTYSLPHHPQHADPNSVEWSKGAVKIARAADPNGPKKVLEVLLAEHVGDGQLLVLHVLDGSFDPVDPVVTGLQVNVSYYPGYKVYLHADIPHNFTDAAILPAAGEGIRKTWLGARSRDTAHQCYSPVGIPAPIVAIEFVEPMLPARPSGPEFATQPDFYYKSSYTFLLDFAANHKPFSVVFYRANEEAILRALYKNTTYDAVRQQLQLLGEDDPHLTDRWKDLTGFTYVNGAFREFPQTNGYAFPNPDKGGALNGSPPGSIINEIKEAIWGAFTALTELPLIYDFIKGPTYVPGPRRQNIRNAQGTLLTPNDPEFDMAPMAKRTGNGFEIQFTDFTLDGTGSNLFFYCAREIGNRGRLGDPGPISGPIQLINTRPPDAPQSRKISIEERNPQANTGPAVNLEVNGYADAQNVRRMLIYRATSAADALSVRMMQLVKTVDLAATNQLGMPRILLVDDFENGFVPYGDPLFYRIVALRQVKTADGGTDWAPSQPSKVLLTAIPDSVNPDAPQITFASNALSGMPAVLTGVSLSWPTTVYNGTYYLERMNKRGHWVPLYRIKSNNSVINVNLAATDLGTDTLPKEDAPGGRPIHHRFRVRAENSSGLFNLTDKVLII